MKFIYIICGVLILAIIFFIGFLFNYSEFNGPKQPDLTEKEIAYFEQMKLNYLCGVEREIEPGIIARRRTKEVGSYMLRLYNWNCDSLYTNRTDSIAFEVSKELYCNCLEKSSTYNEIIILVDCESQKNCFYSRYFHYGTEQIMDYCK